MNIAATFIGMAVAAEVNISNFGLATKNSLKSLSGGKILTLNRMYGNRLRLEVT